MHFLEGLTSLYRVGTQYPGTDGGGNYCGACVAHEVVLVYHLILLS